ncbi:MAG: hypothetical protein ACPF9I_07155, partial [Candidatus Thalassarchaeaceae archaeon]
MSSGGSYAKFYDVGGQYKNLTPKFDSLKLPGGKYDETNFLDWLTRVGNVVRNHPPVGLNIEEFLDVFLNRGAVRVNTLPDWIMSDPSLRVDVVSDTISRSMGAQSRQFAPLGHTSISLGSGDSSEANATEDDYLSKEERTELNEALEAIGSSNMTERQKAKLDEMFAKLSPKKPEPSRSSQAAKPWLENGGTLNAFTPEMVALDHTLFVSLSNMLMGTDIYHVVSPLGSGPTARYTYAVIALMRHHGASASSRRIKAMNAVDDLTYHGDPKKWKLDLMNATREIYEARVTIEHFVMAAALKSLNDKGLSTVQMMMVNDINDEDTMVNCNFDMLSSKYMVALETMNAGKKSGRTSSAERVKCEYCKKFNHTADVCRQKKRDQAAGKPPGSSGTFTGTCGKCGKEGHKRRDCPQKKPSPTNHVAEDEEASSADEDETAQINMIMDMVRGRRKAKLTGSVRKGQTNSVRVSSVVDTDAQPMISEATECRVPLDRKSLGQLKARLVKAGIRENENAAHRVTEVRDVRDCFLTSEEHAVKPVARRNARYSLKYGRKWSSDEDGDGPRDLVKELELMKAGLTETEAIALARVQMAKTKPKGKPGHKPKIRTAFEAMQQMYDADDGLALSLLDGIGCSALGLREARLFTKAGITEFASVEKDEDVRRVGAAVHQETPGYTQGFMGVHDIDHITEDMIRAIPKNVLKVLFGSPMCNDFSKLRLLPDREDYRGPKRKPGEDPRPGLDGKYGKT